MLPIHGKKELGAKLIAIPTAALIASHYVFSRRFPWQPDYAFPLVPFCTVMFIMTTVWFANVQIYKRLDKILPFHRDPLRRIFRQFVEGGTVTVALFITVYTLLSFVVFGGSPSLAGFTSGLLVCTVISSLVNGIYIAAYLVNTISFEKQQSVHAIELAVRQLTRQEKPMVPTEAPKRNIIIETASKTLALEATEIAYFYSSGGMVWLMKKDGQKLLTNLDSFAKIEAQLPEPTFFRLNRQYIVHWQAVRSVAEAVNRKLTIQVIPAFQSNFESTSITVSRYRAAEFRKWFAQLTQA